MDRIVTMGIKSKLFLFFIFQLSFTCFASKINCLWDRLYPDPYFKPYFKNLTDSSRPDIYLMSMQDYFNEPEKIDLYKKDMLDGKFDFTAERAKIGGYYHERSRVYFISEGNRRMAAALEIAKETGNWSNVKLLLHEGLWEKTDSPPAIRYRTPVRKNGLLDRYNWYRFLLPSIPTRNQLTQ